MNVYPINVMKANFVQKIWKKASSHFLPVCFPVSVFQYLFYVRLPIEDFSTKLDVRDFSFITVIL